MNKHRIAAATLVAGTLALTGCTSDADRASENLSKGAEQFEIERRVVMFNGITDTSLLVIQGRCSIAEEGGALGVTCKIGPDQYKKHYFGLSDNVSYFVEQGDPVDADEYRYRVIIKPEAILPDFDVETSPDLEGDG